MRRMVGILPNPVRGSFYRICNVVFSIDKRIFTGSTHHSRAALEKCPCPVRRNASSGSRLFSSPTFKRSAPCTQIRPSGKSGAAIKSILRTYGFSDADISHMQERTAILNLSASNNLLPKLKFFASFGLCSGNLRNVFLRVPYVASSSLQKQLIPCYDFLKGVPLDDKQIVRIINIFPGILLAKVKTVLAPNVRLLRESGVSQSCITSLVLRYTSTMCREPEKFKSFFNQGVALGLHPSMNKFVPAMHVFASNSKDKLDHKVNVCKSFGLLDDEITLLFRRHPTVMALSEKNIARSMKFFINELGWPPSKVASHPEILLFSFEKRVLRRILVLEKLVKSGFTPKLSPISILKLTEANFFERFIEGYKEKLPDILDIYRNGTHCWCKTDI